MNPIVSLPHDQLTYWLMRLSAALQRLNDCLVWATSSPGKFADLLAEPQFSGGSLRRDLASAAIAMRRFADLMLDPEPSWEGAELSVWEELILGLRVLLAACAQESHVWLAADAPASAALIRELRATVHAVERLSGAFQRVH